LLVTVNNTATGSVTLVSGLRGKLIGGGSTTAPVDLASVNDGDAMTAGQTVRFRLYPPDGIFPGSDFLVNGAPLRIHTGFEALITAPANGSSFDLQPVLYASDGRVWRMPSRRVQILPDFGRTLSGHAVRADGSPAVWATVGVRVNGLSAEYFQADKGLTSWSDLNRAPDRRGFVTAINQPGVSGFGEDPFGTGFSGAYGARFRGEILVSAPGEHQFFLDAPLGARLIVDGRAWIDTPAGQASPESNAAVALTAGWHTIEIDSYHTASNTNLELSWRQPNSDREIVRPEALAADLGLRAITDANGSFRFGTFPSILNPLDGHPIPADKPVQVILDPTNFEERPIQP